MPRVSLGLSLFSPLGVRNGPNNQKLLLAGSSLQQCIVLLRVPRVEGASSGQTLVRPIHVAAFIEELLQDLSKPSVKQHLAALRMLFDWLVIGLVIDVNPAHAVRGPKHSVRKGKTPVLTAEEARTLL